MDKMFFSPENATLLVNRFLLYKIEWFIDFSATNDNLTCVDYHGTH